MAKQFILSPPESFYKSTFLHLLNSTINYSTDQFAGSQPPHILYENSFDNGLSVKFSLNVHCQQQCYTVAELAGRWETDKHCASTGADGQMETSQFLWGHFRFGKASGQGLSQVHNYNASLRWLSGRGQFFQLVCLLIFLKAESLLRMSHLSSLNSCGRRWPPPAG